MRIILALIIMSFLASPLLAQNFKTKLNYQDQLTFQLDDTIIKADVIIDYNDFNPSEKLIYHWCKQGKLAQTKGGYDGYLLDGTCIMYYDDKSLLAKGEFKKGLKTGTWKTWHNSGAIKSKTEWANGWQNGAYAFYNHDGALQEEGSYKTGKRHGTTKYYNGTEVIEEKKFELGEVVVPKEKPEKVKKQKKDGENAIEDKEEIDTRDK